MEPKEKDQSVTHSFEVREVLLPFLENGTKTVEVRTAKPRFKVVKQGDAICFNRRQDLTFDVVRIGRYENFPEMLEHEDPNSIVPGFSASAIEKMLNMFYRPKDEQLGVLAFEIVKQNASLLR